MHALRSLALTCLLTLALSGAAQSQPPAPDERARTTEAQMTDDERFALIISLLGPAAAIGIPRDTRIPDDVKNTSAGYTPGIPRLGVPALQSSDASMGVTNPGYRPDDKGATAFPASLVVGASFNPPLARDGGSPSAVRRGCAGSTSCSRAGSTSRAMCVTAGTSSTTAKIPGTAP